MNKLNYLNIKTCKNKVKSTFINKVRTKVEWNFI